MGSRSVLKYFVPKGIWLRRTVILFAFIFLDYIVTVTFCTSPAYEANPNARSFMETYGITVGLAVFDFFLGLPIYAILCLDSHLIEYTGHYSKKAEVAIDLTLGWLIAGAHFNGAASWVWDTSGIIPQVIGFIAYEAIALSCLYSFSKPIWARSQLKLSLVKGE